MAFGSRFTSSMFPRGLSPEDEDFLRRQMFSQMGNALMANAFQGGDWRGLGSAIEPMNAMPGEAMKLMRFREEQAQEERQRRIAELAMQHSISGEERAVRAEGREVEKHNLNLDDRHREEVERESDAWNTSEDLIEGAAVRARVIPWAEQQLAAKGAKLGPAAAELAGEIEALRNSGTVGHSAKGMADWISNFSAKLSAAEKGERSHGLAVRTQSRLEEAEDRMRDSADARNIVVVKGDGFVTTLNKVTGEMSGFVTLPDGKQEPIPAHILRIAEEQAKMEIVGTSTVSPKWTPGLAEKINKRAGEIVKQLMGISGATSVPQRELTPEELAGGFGIPVRLRQP